MVIYDYLGRSAASSHLKFAKEYKQLSYNLQCISDTVNELNLAGLVLSQIDREAEEHEPPKLKDAYGTGDIERFSNQVIGWAVAEDGKQVKWAIRKNTFGEKHGVVCSGVFVFDARRSQFLEQ